MTTKQQQERQGQHPLFRLETKPHVQRLVGVHVRPYVDVRHEKVGRLHRVDGNVPETVDRVPHRVELLGGLRRRGADDHAAAQLLGQRLSRD